MKITSVIEFMQWMNKSSDADIYFDMYRGQPDEKFILVPSIVRYVDCVKHMSNSTTDIEEQLIEWLEKYSAPYKDYRSVSYLEKLIDGQHYGLPTRLLDWTTNPLKALYFAVENPVFDNVNGVVYGFAPEHWWEGTKHVKLNDKLGAFFPEFLNERISAQEGCFTSFPLPTVGFNVLPLNKKNYPRDIEALEKVLVQANAKAKIRFELNKLGISQGTIYPGLEGVAKWVKSDFSGYSL